jgi:carotenoid cleavage dioxygenase
MTLFATAPRHAPSAPERRWEVCVSSSSPDAAEDDGVLMGFVYDRLTDRSELATIDARPLRDIASIKLPHRVPAGFHGNWVPSTD